MKQPILAIQNLSAGVEGRQILKGINFTYLRTRGIPLEKARRMLIHAFAEQNQQIAMNP